MLFGLNYSRAAADLLTAGKISIDRFKCPNWPDLIDEARRVSPVYVHFDLTAGEGRLAKQDWNAIERLMVQTDTQFLNLHLSPRIEKVEPHFDDPNSPEAREHLLGLMRADLQVATQRMGARKVIVENIPFRGATDRYFPIATEPATFQTLLSEFNCGLLFDISHARMAAAARGVDARAYIEALPLERTREVHITGLQIVDGALLDHMDMLDDDWMWVASTLDLLSQRQAPMWIGSMEYGGVSEKFEWRTDPAIIEVQIPRLAAMVRPR